MEGEVSEPQFLIIPDEASEIAAENLDIISEVILEKPIDAEFAKTYSRLYTIHTIAGIDAVLAGTAKQPQVLVDFNELLKEAVEKTKEGDFTDIGRFLQSESEKMRGNPELAPQAKLAMKLKEMVELLPSK